MGRKPTAGDSDSESGSDVSIPRGKRFSPVKPSNEDKDGERTKEKKRKHKHDSDSDSKSKLKNMKVGFNRSISFEGNKKTGGEKILQRSTSSVPTLESLGIAHNYGMPGQIGKPTSLSNLPKIPKLKKQENA